jgi:hypothetical protein
MSEESRLLIYDVHGAQVGEADLVAGEVVFRNPEHRWTWVLDARHAPYSELSLADVLHRAEHANKRWVLVGDRTE